MASGLPVTGLAPTIMVSGSYPQSMSNLLAQFGVEPESFDWQEFASCRRVRVPDIFFDLYEADSYIAIAADQICNSCPVQKDCYAAGIENEETGVWGGVYLTKGKVDQVRNEHKTETVWLQIERNLDG